MNLNQDTLNYYEIMINIIIDNENPPKLKIFLSIYEKIDIE